MDSTHDTTPDNTPEISLIQQLEQQVPTPSYRVRKGAVFFRLGLSIAVSLSGLLTLASCASSPSEQWQQTDALETETIFDLTLATVSQRTPIEEVEQIMVQTGFLSLGKEDDTELLLLRFNHESLCGRWGCLHSIVEHNHQTGEMNAIWGKYLSVEVPVNAYIQLVSPPNGHVQPGAFSCLEITQLQQHTLQQSTECYDDGHYTIVAQHQSSL